MAGVLGRCGGSAVLMSYVLLNTVSIQLELFKNCVLATRDRNFVSWLNYGVKKEDIDLVIEQLDHHYDRCPTAFQEAMVLQKTKYDYNVTIC